jgi:stage II sporulation protein D
MRKKILIVVSTLLILNPGFSQLLRIGLFNDLNTKAIVFTVTSTSYLMTADHHAIQNFSQGENMYIAMEGDSLRCISSGKDYGLFQKVSFNAMTDSSVFSIRPVNPQFSTRFFDDNLELSVVLGKLQTVNIVDPDKYVAAVVEAEGGPKAMPEYYKAQSVLCRTYALNHLDKHMEEGFNLCDGTHCQAFQGRNSGYDAIVKASRDTRGLVITDGDSVLVTAAFHSNCGGETESAQNVWLINKPYLKPVLDPYCQNQKNFRWEKKISVDQWKSYLLNNGFHLKPDVSTSLFNATQFSRRQYYKIGKDSITFRKIRSDFKLRSAYFSTEAKNGNIEIHGRGYGHGVGLCQEGAMQMAKLGYNFREIIQFYYQGVNVSDFKDAPDAKNSILKILFPKN